MSGIVSARKISPQRRARLHRAMAYVGDMAAKTPKPESYRWEAKWWRLHAKESMVPSESEWYAEGQMVLYRDMLARPAHFASPLRPFGLSDWLWSQKGRDVTPIESTP